MLFWERYKTITAFYEKSTRTVREKYDLTQMQFDILMFLCNNPIYDTAADIVKLRRLTKSHVSAALKDLETRELIGFCYAPDNKKSRHIRILQNAEEIIAAGERVQIEFGEKLFRGFTPEQMQECRDLFHRMFINAEKELESVEE